MKSEGQEGKVEKGKDCSQIKSKESGLGERGGDKESYRYNTFICKLRMLSLL